MLCYSVIGMILLNGFGPMLLRSTEKEDSTRPLVADDSENPSENTQLADSPLQARETDCSGPCFESINLSCCQHIGKLHVSRS